MPDYQPIDYRLRCHTKRTDLPSDVLRDIGEAYETIQRLTKERDEARRSCCEYAAIVDGADTTEGMESGRFYERAMKYMKDRGWDCFKENTND